jgi:hypothetical protein
MKHRITFIDSLRPIPDTNFDGLRTRIESGKLSYIVLMGHKEY